MPELHELTVSEAAQRIKDRDLSPVELVQALLGRIDAMEPSLKAWVYLDREAHAYEQATEWHTRRPAV